MRALLLFLCCAPAILAADESCPWMNAATAGGYLQASPHATFTKNGDGGVCDFSGRRGTTAVDLRIEVSVLAEARTPSCGPQSSPLRAFGNEAAVCSYDDKSGKVSEQVVGRERKQAFTVRLTSSDPQARRGDIRAAVLRAAEQVVGNLY